MPRMLTRAGMLVALLTPAFAIAAYNDVTLTTDTVLSVNGVTLNVSGSSATIESITVNDTDFSVTLQSDSVFQVTAPNLERLTASTLTGNTAYTCSSSQSLIKYEPGTQVSVTITPSSTLCSSSGSSSGSTGGSSTPTASPTPAASAAPETPAVTPAVPAAPAVPATPAAPAVSASGLSTGQIQSILDVLASFDADPATIASVKASLEGTGGTLTGSVTSTAVAVFKSNLTVGSLGSEVKALQEFLNARGYTVAASGAGSPGKETTRFGAATKAALIKFQKAKGITPASGYFGPLTRAAVNAAP